MAHHFDLLVYDMAKTTLSSLKRLYNLQQENVNSFAGKSVHVFVPK